jgi:hypothetical protein
LHHHRIFDLGGSSPVNQTLPAFTWKPIAAGIEGPGPRSRHGLTFDRGAKAAVLFGGIVWAKGGRLKSDTWELKDDHWSPVRTTKRPTARHRGAMVFDERRGFSVLFGGQASTGAMLGDTWVYADRHWQSRRFWWRRPESRCGHALAFDETEGVAVLFGGIGTLDRTLSDTWLFDGDFWQKLRGPGPKGRRYAAFAYDPGLQGCVLHGGAVDDAGRHQFGDAWLFRDRSWTPLPSGYETDVRDDHGLAYHHAAGMLIMLDGLGGTRGVLGASPGGWQGVACMPLHPRHQCSPLAWDDNLQGLIRYGGETGHGGSQFDATLVLKLDPGNIPNKNSGEAW